MVQTVLDISVCAVYESLLEGATGEVLREISDLIYQSLFGPQLNSSGLTVSARGDYLERRRRVEGAGPGVSSTDKLLFTVQIYESVYVPNRKTLRFIEGNGTVGNTPGDWQIRLLPLLCLFGQASGLLHLIQLARTFWERGEVSGQMRESHNSARYRQLIVHLIKSRVIKIGWANG